jgi:hypothetical protein
VRLLTAAAAGGAGGSGPSTEERCETKEAFLETVGEWQYSEEVSLEEVVWHEPRDSTDHEERSRERGLCDFMVTLRSRVLTL